MKGVHKLDRGLVFCTVCNRKQAVDVGYALSHGWPKCCGYTMSLDSPSERNAFHQLRDSKGRFAEMPVYTEGE